jgi:hypothetical protein
MDTLNGILTALVDGLLAPFAERPATGLVLWSVVTGVGMAYVIGKTSNQRALRRAADNIRAQLFAIKLFKDDLVVTLHCQMALLKSTGARLLHSLPPMLVMAFPLLMILAQLAMRFEHRPLLPGERAVVAMRVKPDHWKEVREVSLNAGERFEVETGGLRDERDFTIYWRVRAVGVESESLQWRIGDETIEKLLPMAASRDRLLTSNPKRSGITIADQLLYPAERSLASSSPIESIDIQLMPRETLVFGWNVPWWATFFVVSMVVTFTAGKWMGVQF